MQDARLRVGATLLLSLAAFSGITGALLVVLWWLIFTPSYRVLPEPKATAGIIVMTTLVAVFMQAFGGDGISYMIRLGTVFLIAAWAYSERQSGEMLDISVWLLGNRSGFDLGMVAEMGLTSFSRISIDLVNLKHALELKGMSWGPAVIVPAVVNLVQMQITRTREQARILAIRGYRTGGSLCPEFRTDRSDLISFAFAICIAVFVFLHFGDIFIVTK